MKIEPLRIHFGNRNSQFGNALFVDATLLYLHYKTKRTFSKIKEIWDSVNISLMYRNTKI